MLYDVYSNVYEIIQGMCLGIYIVQSLSMKTNTDIKKHSEDNALIHSRLICVTYVLLSAPASSTAGPRQTTRSVENEVRLL